MLGLTLLRVLFNTERLSFGEASAGGGNKTAQCLEFVIHNVNTLQPVLPSGSLNRCNQSKTKEEERKAADCVDYKENRQLLLSAK